MYAIYLQDKFYHLSHLSFIVYDCFSLNTCEIFLFVTVERVILTVLTVNSLPNNTGLEDIKFYLYTNERYMLTRGEILQYVLQYTVYDILHI